MISALYTRRKLQSLLGPSLLFLSLPTEKSISQPVNTLPRNPESGGTGCSASTLTLEKAYGTYRLLQVLGLHCKSQTDTF